MSQFLWWCLRTGNEVDDQLFHPDVVDSFIAQGLPNASKGTRLNYQSQLKAVGRSVLGYPVYPAPGLKLNTSDPTTPYSSDEIAALWSFASALSTSGQRRNAQALVSFCVGAGLKAEEVNTVIGTDVSRGTDGVFVQLPERSGSRLVPVRAAWEDEVWAIAELVGLRPVFRPDRAAVNRKDISRFVEHLPRTDAPRLVVARLRVTWIVNQLEAGVRLDVIAAAAGVGATQIAGYAPYMTTTDEATRTAALRGSVG